MVSATYNNMVSCFSNISGCVSSMPDMGSLSALQEQSSNWLGTMVPAVQEFATDNAIPITTTGFILLAGSFSLRRYGVPTILTYPLAAMSAVPARMTSLVGTIREFASSRWASSPAAARAFSSSSEMSSLSASDIQNAMEAASSWGVGTYLTTFKDAAWSRVASYGSVVLSSPSVVWGEIRGISSHVLHFLSYSKGMIQSGASSGLDRASGWASSAFSYIADEKVKLASKGILSALGFGWGGYKLYSSEASETQKLENRIEDAEHLRSQILQKFGLNILDFSNYDEINNQLTAFQNHSTGCFQRKEAYDHVALRLNQKTKDFFKGMSDQEKKSAVAFVSKPLDLNMGKPHDAAMQLKTVVDTLHDCHSLKAQDTEEISRLSNNVGKLTARSEQCQKDLINAHNAIISAKKEAIAVGCHAEFEKTRTLANAKTNHQVDFATCEAKREICENELKSKGQGWFNGIFGKK